MQCTLEKLPFRTLILTVAFALSGFGPALPVSDFVMVYGLFIFGGILLETQLGHGFWRFVAVAAAGILLALNVSDAPGINTALAALHNTMFFALIWLFCRQGGVFLAFMAVLVYGLNMVHGIAQMMPAQAVTYGIGYAAGALWVGFEMCRALVAELNILNLRRGNKMY